MGRLTKLTMVILASLVARHASARNIDQLEMDGFSVISTTEIDGDFVGCLNFKGIKLRDGSMFYCSGPGSHYAHRPNAILLKNELTGEYALLIDGAEYQGGLHVQRTHGSPILSTTGSPDPVFPSNESVLTPPDPGSTVASAAGSSKSVAESASQVPLDRGLDRSPTTDALLPDIERVYSLPVRAEDQAIIDPTVNDDQ